MGTPLGGGGGGGGGGGELHLGENFSWGGSQCHSVSNTEYMIPDAKIGKDDIHRHRY